MIQDFILNEVLKELILCVCVFLPFNLTILICLIKLKLLMTTLECSILRLILRYETVISERLNLFMDRELVTNIILGFS